jgi:predicted ABC-type ATPase
MSVPILYVIAGPNGIGKTTSDFDFVPKNTPVINSDEIAAEARTAGKIKSNTQEYANRESAKLIDNYLASRSSFAFETNLNDIETWKFLLKVQESGYQIHVIYISTNNLEILNARIKDRVNLGGHFVRPDIVEERYLTGLNLLNHYSDKPDKLQLFDNSATMQLVAEISKGQILHAALQLPSWVTQYLGNLFNAEIKMETKARDLNSIEDVRKRYLENRQKLENNKQSGEPDPPEEVRKSKGRNR